MCFALHSRSSSNGNPKKYHTNKFVTVTRPPEDNNFHRIRKNIKITGKKLVMVSIYPTDTWPDQITNPPESNSNSETEIQGNRPHKNSFQPIVFLYFYFIDLLWFVKLENIWIFRCNKCILCISGIPTHNWWMIDSLRRLLWYGKNILPRFIYIYIYIHVSDR